jgi:hypothetical protein
MAVTYGGTHASTTRAVLPLNTLQVTNAVVVIVLDLSDPGSVLSNALHWLGLVRQKLTATYGLFEKRGLAQLPQQLKSRHRNKTFSQQHPDAQLVDCLGELWFGSAQFRQAISL